MNKLPSENDTVFYLRTENGQFQFENNELTNRGCLFGDGIFETMIFTWTEFRFATQHIYRATKGCQMLDLVLNVDEAFSLVELFVKEKYDGQILRVRWNIFRSSKGKYTPISNDTQQSLIIEPFCYLSPQSKVAFINEQFSVPNLPWSNCKTLNAMLYVQAGIARKKAGFEEIILLDTQGHVCEAGAANLFWVKDGIYYTPSLKTSCIEGVSRCVIIKKLKELEIKVLEGEYNPSEVLKADLVFTSNVTGIHYISKINSTGFCVEPVEFLESLFEV